MFCIKNSDGLFFEGFAYVGGGKMKEQWSDCKMLMFASSEEALEAANNLDVCCFEISPVSVGGKKEKIKDKRYLYTSAYDPIEKKFVGIDHAFERHGVFYFVCYYTQYGEMFVLEEERLIRFCL